MQTLLKILIVFFASFFFLTTVGCSSTSTTESTGEYIDSSAITAKVKAALFDKLGADSMNIKVKTFKDHVQLSGFVKSQKVKDSAGNIAQSVNDVNKVTNDLIVK